MRRLALGAVALAVGSSAFLTSTPALADPAVPVTGDAVPLTGVGFGHGHGMSQYGANGAAAQGLPYDQILAYYYPGTELSSVSTTLRILVTADTGKDTVVAPGRNLRVRDTADRKTFTLPTSPTITRWRIVPHKNSAVSKVQYLRNGTWRRWKVPGRTNLRGQGEFKAATPTALVLPNGSTRRYRGWLRNATTPAGGGTRGTLNVVSLENYVQGVVASEMPSSWRPAALQAQSVAARTYAVTLQRSRSKQWYHLCDTTACQVYGGYTAEATSTNAAIKATAGRIVTYRGASALTQFSSSSGGFTAKGGADYLVAKADPYDPATPWRASITAGRVASAYPKIGALQSVQVVARDGNGQWGGRVTTLRLTGASGSVDISGERARSLFGLRSTWFTAG